MGSPHARASGSDPQPSRGNPAFPASSCCSSGWFFSPTPPARSQHPKKQSSHHGRAVPEAASPRGAALRASPGIADASGLPRARGLAETSYYSVPRSSLHISARFHYRSCSEGGGGSKAGCLWALFNRHFLIWGKKGDWMLPPGIFCPPTCSSNDFWPCGEQRMRERRPEPCVVQEGKVLSPLAAPWGRHHPLLHQAQRTASAPRASRPVPQPLSSA